MDPRLTRSAAALGFVLVLAWCAPARAQRAEVVQNPKGYRYVFKDGDQLHSDGATAGQGLIHVRPIAARSTLIRPRVSFVAELLKSVEHL